MSFGWTCMFRKGSWVEFRRFALLQRRNVEGRIFHINQQINKIGSIVIQYERAEGGTVTEKRVGFSVASDSALGKLLTAYIAQGGNPFDISMFLSPDAFSVVPKAVAPEGSEEIDDENAMYHPQPYSGVVYPEAQEEEDYKGIDKGGWIPLWKYPPRKLGGSEKNIFPEADEVGGQVALARGWLSQEIKQLRNDLEARIIKLCDLREQLVNERDQILVKALAGSVAVLEEYDSEGHLAENHLSNIVTNIDLNFFQPSEREGVLVPDFTKPIGVDGVRSPLTLYQCLLDDTPTGEEEWTAL